MRTLEKTSVQWLQAQHVTNLQYLRRAYFPTGISISGCVMLVGSTVLIRPWAHRNLPDLPGLALACLVVIGTTG